MEKVIDKIRKLLALASGKGATENEAAVALSKAQAMMLEHGIKDIGEVTKMSAVWGDPTDINEQHYHLVLAMAAAKLFACTTVNTGHGRYVAFCGFPDNVDAAELTFKYLLEEVEKWYKDFLKEFKGRLDKRGRAEARATFKQACAARLLYRVQKMTENALSDSRALVVVNASLAAANDMLTGAGVQKKQVTTIKRAGFGTGAGAAAGDRIKLQNQVEK